ncbi:MFS transporter, partial [Kibdelosporangium lantanae]
MSDQATAAPGAAPAGVGGLGHRQILTILSGLMLGMLLAALDQTIMGSAMKTIADQLHGQTMQAWATTAYLITTTIATPLYGKLSDIFGRKPMYLTAISVFLAGSLLSGIATSMYELAAFRAVQGIGAGGLMSLALAIIADITSPRERSRYTGYFMGVWGLSSVAGPLIGGLFAGLDTFAGITGWRWVFLLNVPIALVALVVVSRKLNAAHTKVKQLIDFWGAGALT